MVPCCDKYELKAGCANDGCCSNLLDRFGLLFDCCDDWDENSNWRKAPLFPRLLVLTVGKNAAGVEVVAAIKFDVCSLSGAADRGDDDRSVSVYVDKLVHKKWNILFVNLKYTNISKFNTPKSHFYSVLTEFLI